MRFAVGLAAAAVLASSADAFVAQVLPVLPDVSAAIPGACVAFRGSGPEIPCDPPWTPPPRMAREHMPRTPAGAALARIGDRGSICLCNNL